LVVNIEHTEGIRHGSFSIHGIGERFPTQIITSTNLWHANDMRVPGFNFRTNVLEIHVPSRKKLLEDPDYREEQIKKISRIIRQHPDKLCMFVLVGIRSKKISKQANFDLIQFQIDCGFKIIRVFLQYNRDALETAQEYRSHIPEDKTIMYVLDEKLNPPVFEKLYLDAYQSHHDEIIGFIGRVPKRTNNNIRLNLLFIKDRHEDQIIRLVSFTKKWYGGVASSLILHLFGFDLYSFKTGTWRKVPIEEIRVLSQFSSQFLTRDSDFVCVVTGNSLYDSSVAMDAEGKSFVPASIHNIVRLNQSFETLEENYTRPQLELIAGDWYF
jgi:hypothetical protein